MFPSMANELLAHACIREREDRTIPAVLRQAAYGRALGGGAAPAPASWRRLSRRFGGGLVRTGRWLEGAAPTASGAAAERRGAALTSG